MVDEADIVTQGFYVADKAQMLTEVVDKDQCIAIDALTEHLDEAVGINSNRERGSKV
jgi:hypothetical protein